MASIEQRVYELGCSALADQERHIGEVRARAPAILAAATVIASLLAGSVFHAGHPRGLLELSATVVGLAGAGATLLCVVLLLRPHEIGFSVDARAAYRSMWEQGILEQPMVDLALAEAFEERRHANLSAVERLGRLLSLALGSLVLETLGLALAAAVSS